jgi:hypothetical protein
MELLLLKVLSIDPVTTQSALAIFRVLVFYPLGLLIKDFSIGMAIRSENTYLTLFSSSMRIVYMLLVIRFLHILTALPGEFLAGIVFVLTPFVEGIALSLFLKLRAKREEGSMQKSIEEESSLNQKEILSFYSPLAFTTIAATLTMPLINGAIGRLSEAAITLTTFAVGYGLVMNFVEPLRRLHQVSIRYGDNTKKVFRFSLFSGIFVTGIIAGITLTPLGTFLLERAVGLDSSLTQAAMGMMRLFLPMPLIVVIRDYFKGMLMRSRRTTSLGIGKVLYLLTLLGAILLFSVVLHLPILIGAVVAMIAADIAETIILGRSWFPNKRRPETCQV